MNKGNIVKILSGDNSGKAAEVVEVKETEVTIKLLNSEDTYVVKPDEVKRKRVCVCGLSKDYPFCDGSHASGWNMDYDSLKKEINNILFEEGKHVGIHKLYNNNFIIDIDYEKISNLIIETIKEHNAKTSS